MSIALFLHARYHPWTDCVIVRECVASRCGDVGDLWAGVVTGRGGRFQWRAGVRAPPPGRGAVARCGLEQVSQAVVNR